LAVNASAAAANASAAAATVSADLTSVKGAFLSGLGKNVQMQVVGNTQGCSSTTFASANAKISGLSVSVAASGVYEVNALLIHRMSGTVNTYRFGVSTSAATFAQVAGEWWGMVSAIAGGDVVTTIVNHGHFNEAGIGSAIYSALAGTTNTTYFTRMNGLFVISTAGGTLQLKCLVSATAAPLNILNGSFVRAYKLA
jgi:hypothetical protein